MDESTAISRLQQGDPSGLEWIFKAYQVRAVHTAYAIVFDRAVAEEVAQTAFVRVADRIDQFDPARAFAPWFYKIVVNEAIRVARQQKRSVTLDDDPDEQVAVVARWLTDPHPQPERLLEARQTQEVILAAIARLKPEQRAVVVMRYYLEMNEAEMSAQMERPLSTIKWWLRAARERLNTLLRRSTLFEDHERRS